MRVQVLKNSKLALPIGLLAFVIAIIIDRFIPKNEGLDFVEGFLFAMAIFFILSNFLSLRKQK